MYSLLFMLFLPCVLGQFLSKDLCPFKGNDSILNFDSSQYLGKWYEIKRYETFFEFGNDCVTATYTDEGEGKIGVSNSQTDLKTKVTKTIKGFAVPKYAEMNNGQLLVQFPRSPLSDYWIVDTDYNNYSIVFTCYDLPATSSVQFLWLLSRTPNYTKEIQATVDSILLRNNIKNENLISPASGEKKCEKYYNN